MPFDPCKYEFWPRAANMDLFIDPKTQYIGYDWNVGATVQSDLKIDIPEDWANRPIIAISFDENCEEHGYRYKNYYELKEDIDKGKIKGTPDALNNLFGGSGDSEDEDGNNPAAGEDNKGKKIPLLVWIIAGVVTYKIIKD